MLTRQKPIKFNKLRLQRIHGEITTALINEAPLGVIGIRDRIFEKKIIGIRDTKGKNYRDTEYWKKIYWNIQRELSSQEFLTFQNQDYFQKKIVKIKQINNN